MLAEIKMKEQLSAQINNQNNNLNDIQNDERRRILSQRFSQKELRNGDRITEEAETLLQRGENSSNPELQKEKTGDFSKGEKQEAEIESWAKEKGIWIENTTESLSAAYGDPIAEGGESIVYDNGNTVVKEISLAYFIEPQLALDRIMLHNSISDAKLEVKQFGRNADGEFVIVVEQPFVQGTQLTQDEIVDFMKSLGFTPYNKRNTEFTNGEILINDLHDENVIRKPDGTISIIDADFRLNTSNYGLGGKRTTTRQDDSSEETLRSLTEQEFTEEEFNALVKELELDGDKASSFVINYLKNTLTRNPRNKIKAERILISEFPSKEDLDSTSFMRDTLEEVFGLSSITPIPQDWDSESKLNWKTLRADIESYVKNEWENDLKKKIESVNQGYSSQIEALYAELNYNKFAVQSISDYLHNPKLASDKAKKIAEDIIALHRQRPEVNRKGKKRMSDKQALAFELKLAKEEVEKTKEKLKNAHFARHAKLLKYKNRLVALKTIPNIDTLIAGRVLKDIASHQPDPKKWESEAKPFLDLYNKAVRAQKSSENLEDTNPVFNGLKSGDTLSIEAITERITELHPEYGNLLSLIKKANPEVTFTVLDENDYQDHLSTGVLKPKTNSIEVRLTTPVDKIVHELVHAGTSYLLKSADSEGNMSVKDSVQNLMDYLTDYIKNTTGKNYKPGNFYGVKFPSDIYGFTDPHEFIAEVLTNKKFQELLDSIPAMEDPKHKSLLREIFDTILEYVNNLISKKSRLNNTALAQAQELAYSTLMLQSENIDGILKLIKSYNDKKKSEESSEEHHAPLNQENPVTGQNNIQAAIDPDVRMTQEFIGNKARKEFSEKLHKARPDLTDAEIDAALDFLHQLADNKENNAYIKTVVTWFCNDRNFNPAVDHERAMQTFAEARKRRIDISKYKTLTALLMSDEMKPKEREKRKFDPDSEPAFSNKRTVTLENGRTFIVYDVLNSEEGQRAVCHAVAAHYEVSPWCLSTFTKGSNEPTQSAKYHWKEYGKAPRRIAYENGRPVAFNSARYSKVKQAYNSLQGFLVSHDRDGNYHIYEPPKSNNIRHKKFTELLNNGYLNSPTSDGRYILTPEGMEAMDKADLSPVDSWWDLVNIEESTELSNNISNRTPDEFEPREFYDYLINVKNMHPRNASMMVQRTHGVYINPDIEGDAGRLVNPADVENEFLDAMLDEDDLVLEDNTTDEEFLEMAEEDIIFEFDENDDLIDDIMDDFPFFLESQRNAAAITATDREITDQIFQHLENIGLSVNYRDKMEEFFNGTPPNVFSPFKTARRMVLNALENKNTFEKLMNLSEQDLKDLLANRTEGSLSNEELQQLVSMVSDLKGRNLTYDDVTTADLISKFREEGIPENLLNETETIRQQLNAKEDTTALLPYSTFKEHEFLLENVLPDGMDFKYDKAAKCYRMTPSQKQAIEKLINLFSRHTDYGALNAISDAISSDTPVNITDNAKTVADLMDNAYTNVRKPSLFDDIQAFYTPKGYIKISSKREYAILTKYLFEKFRDNSSFGCMGFTDKFFYLCDYFGERDFQIKAQIQIDGNEDLIKEIANEVKDKTFRNPEDFNLWFEDFKASRREHNSSWGDVTVRYRGGRNGRMALPKLQEKGVSNTGTSDGQGSGDIQQEMRTSKGELYGFADKEGRLYFDETIITPEHQIHEYTHLWDRAVMRRNPKLWNRGVELMKQTPLWNEYLNHESYGKAWRDKGISGAELDNLIASFYTNEKNPTTHRKNMH